MRYPCFLAAAACLGGVLVLGADPAVAGTLEISPQNTTVSFSVRHLGVSHVEGRFGAFHGVVAYGSEATDVSVDVSVEPSSVDSGIGMRDRSLRTSYLGVEKFPAARFTAHLRSDGGGESLAGTLNLHGVTLPCVLHIESGADAALPLVKRRHVVATTTLSRDAFGIKGTGSFLTMADEVELRIEVDNPEVAP